MAPQRQPPPRTDLLRRLWLELVELAYPPRCALCESFSRAAICEGCLGRVELIVPPTCPVCGVPLPPGVPDGQPCGACRGQQRALDSAQAAGLHRGVLRHAILSMKFAGRRELLDPLAQILAGRLASGAGAAPLADRVEALVPLPLHPTRRRWRGFDQAVLLCRRLERLSGVPALERELARVRNTRPQIGLSPQERAENVRGAFAVHQGTAVRGRSLLVVDDVYTTGATMEAAAEALKAAGARSVHALTISRATPAWLTDAALVGDEDDGRFMAS